MAEVKERLSAYEEAQLEILEIIEPWGIIGLAARINQALNGGRLSDIVKQYIGEPKDEEDFEEQIRK